MKLGELCAILDVPYRHARYVLEEGILPQGVEGTPGRGEHRQLSPQQAFWLAIVLYLKQAGIKAPLAGQIASMCHDAIRTVTKNLGWDHAFDPFKGKFETPHRYYVEIADHKFFRLTTDAVPGSRGQLYEFDWIDLSTRSNHQLRPVVTVRIDLAGLSSLFLPKQ